MTVRQLTSECRAPCEEATIEVQQILEPLMRVAHYPAFGRPAKPLEIDQAPDRIDFFARLIGALHHSRRLQAAQIVRRSQHLTQNASAYDARVIFERTHKGESD